MYNRETELVICVTMYNVSHEVIWTTAIIAESQYLAGERDSVDENTTWCDE